ncbi:hypothetical protein [uncultured Sulfitobacter sp.]|jgi:hypothetical protein|uniref:hypothetical protein n=1 Tax=uncultured Sulfitobacter sp. TaxID=191468 RepID=UPI0030F55097
MTKTPTKTTTPTDMDSWAMACSLLVGVRQAIAKGKAEHAAITEANPNRTFFAEAAVVADTVAILQDVERALDWELSRTARSSNLAMPERG